MASDRECSFTFQATQTVLPITDSSSQLVNPGTAHSHVTSAKSGAVCLTSVHYDARVSNKPTVYDQYDPTSDDAINFSHMELLIHLTLNNDMFNLGVGIEDYHSFGLPLGLKAALKAPYLMYQILAFSARHLAFLNPERSQPYLHQVVILQTRAVSQFTAVPIDVDQSNCVPVLLFSSVLGHHLFADTLVTRDARGLDAFIVHYVQCVQTYRGVYNIAVSAWPLFMESELASILSLSKSFTSREPKGNDCQGVSQRIESTLTLTEGEKDACRRAIQYLQVGLDAALAVDLKDVPINRFQMISEWTMLVPPEFTSMLARKRPEALIVLAHYALLLHHGRHLWQVGDAGAYILGIIGDHLGLEWDCWLEYPRARVNATVS